MDQKTLRGLQEELRRDLLPLTVAPVALAGLALPPFCSFIPTPSALMFGLLLLGLAIATLALRGRWPVAAAWLLVLGIFLAVYLAWRWRPSSGVQNMLAVPLVVAAMTLGPLAAALVGAGATVLLLGRAGPAGLSAMDADSLITLGVLWTLVYLLVVSQRSQRTMVAWAWNGFTQARRHLEAARNRQVELKQALEDLSLARAQAVRLNELLLASRRAVEEARQAKEDFVAKVSHELRTPLNMIIGFSDMILASPQVYSRRLPAALLADIASIKRNSQHLASLVDDVLGLAEADSGRMRLFQEMASLPAVVAEAVESVQVFYTKKGLRLEVDLPGDLPAVYCDRVRVRQVLINLLSNSARFTETGGACVAARLEGGNVQISVSDTGPGMEPESIRRVFEPFQQGDDSIRRRYGGTGLGLTISKRLVEMHQGRIWIESCVGQGTTVYFTLPIHRPATDDPTRRWFSPYQVYEARTRSAALPDGVVRPQIMVIDQGEDLGRLLARYCERFEVVPVPSPDDIKAALAECAPSALVMGRGAGLGDPSDRPLSVSLPETPVDMPLLIMHTRRATVVHAQGIRDYLIKPIHYAALVRSVEAVAPKAGAILLAEDDAEARQLFTRMLNAANPRWSILYAANGEEALRLLREEHPDLALLDLAMPVADGYYVLQVKENDEGIRDIPVIVISATDPQREPRVLDAVTVTRRGGLSYQEATGMIESLICALQPRISAVGSPEIAHE